MRPAMTLASTPGKESSVSRGQVVVERGGQLAEVGRAGPSGSRRRTRGRCRPRRRRSPTCARGRTGGRCRSRRRPGPGPPPRGRAAAPARCRPATTAGCRRRARRTGSSGRKPPHFDGVAAAGVLERVAVVVEVGVPPVGGTSVTASTPATMFAQNAADVGGAGEDAGHADDRDVERAGGVGGVGGVGRVEAQRRHPVGEEGGRPVGHLGVQVGDGGDVVPQGGDLADHVHAVAAAGRPRRPSTSRPPSRLRPLVAIRSRPRLSCLQLGPHRPAATRPPPSAAGGPRRRPPRSGVGAQRVAWPGAVSSSTVSRHSTACALEAGEDRAGGHRLLGEQVGGAHQHADRGAARRRAARPAAATIAADRASWMPPANRTCRSGTASGDGQEALDLDAPTARSWRAGRRGRRTRGPRRRTGGRRPQEAVEQAGRGDVQVGGDAGRLERRGLDGRPPAMSAYGRADLVDDRQLRLAHLGRARSRGCRRPRAGRRAASAVSVEQAADLVARMQREGQERQPAALGHGRGERGPVADPGHRPLDDGVARGRLPAGGRRRR